MIATYGDIPMQTFTLGYQGISSITFNANAHNFAGVQMPYMDNLAFTRADTVSLNFESLSNLNNAATYLAGYGITVGGLDSGSGLVAFDETITYGGGVVGAPSGKMYITQAAVSSPGGPGTGGAAAPPPNSFILNFSSGLTSFGFSDSAILQPSINSPWTATAYSGPNATGSVLDTESYYPSAVHGTAVFALTGASIFSVKIDQNPSVYGAFYASNLDNFVLTGPGVTALPVPEPETYAMLLAGLGLLGFTSRRKKNPAA